MALLSLGKLINQLNKIVFGLAALAGVSDTAIEVRPVASTTSAESILGFTRIIEYYYIISWPIFLGILVT
jgi:hypothetical protein